MVTEPSPAEQLPPLIVVEALTRAINGDAHGGGMLIVPLIEESRVSCFALCVMLATAAKTGMNHLDPPSGPSVVVLQVEDVETGEAADVSDLRPDVVFAARFTAAWANEDHDTAQALFDALAADTYSEAGMTRLVDGVLALYSMAIATTRALVDAERDTPTQRKD
ncbi:hypothetical protein ABZ682_22715 [Streptomyces griseoviridis]|uniref:hypothetical protein n=1 Tax=Streptomyces griseoviridis TaxID=45398 RepID=UPI0033D3FE05